MNCKLLIILIDVIYVDIIQEHFFREDLCTYICDGILQHGLAAFLLKETVVLLLLDYWILSLWSYIYIYIN